MKVAALVSLLAFTRICSVLAGGGQSACQHRATRDLRQRPLRGDVDGQPGKWAGAQPITYADQWRRCDKYGSFCTSIVGATGPDVHARRRRHRPAGSAARHRHECRRLRRGPLVEFGRVVAPPVNTALPSLSGIARRGETLMATTGTWIGTPTITYAPQWRRCDAAGNNCTNISGATGSRYLLASPDVGNRVHAQVTATNGYGTAVTRTSNSSAVVGAPENTALPTISGNAQVGRTLAGTPGSWAGTLPISYAFQWRRCNSAGGSCGRHLR